MGAWNFSDLKRHKGHKIAFVHYGSPTEVANVTVECMDCCEVIVSFDRGVKGFNELNMHHGHIGKSKKFNPIGFSGKPPHTVMLKCPECGEVLLKYQRVKILVADGVIDDYATVRPPDVELQIEYKGE